MVWPYSKTISNARLRTSFVDNDPITPEDMSASESLSSVCNDTRLWDTELICIVLGHVSRVVFLKTNWQLFRLQSQDHGIIAYLYYVCVTRGQAIDVWSWSVISGSKWSQKQNAKENIFSFGFVFPRIWGWLNRGKDSILSFCFEIVRKIRRRRATPHTIFARWYAGRILR